MLTLQQTLTYSSAVRTCSRAKFAVKHTLFVLRKTNLVLGYDISNTMKLDILFFFIKQKSMPCVTFMKTCTTLSSEGH